MYIDTHCHLDFDLLHGRLGEITEKSCNIGLAYIVIPAVSRDRFAGIVDLCASNSNFYMALGLHPYFIEQHSERDLSIMEEMLQQNRGGNKLVAIGEIGLDGTCPLMDKQMSFFQAQLKMAEKWSYPVIIHSRKSVESVLQCIAQVKLVGGVVHGFSGSYELLMRYVHCGMKIGVGPVITWSSANKTREAITKAPLEALVLETDSPDMRVEGVAKDEASPLDVLDVYKQLLSIRKESEEEIRHSLWAQSCKLFNLPMSA